MRTVRTAALLALALPLARHAGAQGFVDVERRPALGAPGVVEVVSSTVSIAVAGREARVTIDDRLRNAGGALAEASWLCPLPRDAAFGGFSLWNGETELKGEMLDREHAQGIYEEIVRRRRDPALLTWAGHGLVRSQVFPIAPGETRRMALRYVQYLERSGDALRLRYRLPQADTLARAAGVRQAGARTIVVAVADARETGEPWSPTHRLDVRRRGDAMEIVVHAERGGDVELLLPQRRTAPSLAAIAHAPAGEDGYAMLVLSPPAPAATRPVARDLVLVVDVSGSMAGDKLQQAKAALRQALGTLAPRDRFRLVAFGSAVREFRPGFTAATRDDVADAERFVEALSADGGTNIAGALAVALAPAAGDAPAGPARPVFVLFLTDGVPSVGERDPERIAASAEAALPRGARVLAVGVGADVNTFLLDRLAQAGRGTAEYVAPGGDVEATMGATLRRIARPVLTDLRIVSAPVTLLDAEPAALPDLFDGDEVVAFARYRGAGRGPLVLEGTRDGRRERLAIDADFPAARDADAYVASLWATRRIGTLTRRARLEGASDALVRQIRELGLRHGIITEYTAFLVQEPGVLAAGAPPAAAPAMDARLRGGVAARDAQVGAVAVRRAQASSDAATATTVAAAERAAEARLDEAVSAARGGRPAVRRAGGRVFVRSGDEWTDAGHRASLPVVTVAPWSPAWFALARALPEFARCLGVGDALLVAGRGTAIRVAPGGATELSPARVAQLARAFRGA